MKKYAVTVVFNTKTVDAHDEEQIYYINKNGDLAFLEDLGEEDLYSLYSEAREAAVKYHDELKSTTQVVELRTG